MEPSFNFKHKPTARPDMNLKVVNRWIDEDDDEEGGWLSAVILFAIFAILVACCVIVAPGVFGQ